MSEDNKQPAKQTTEEWVKSRAKGNWIIFAIIGAFVAGLYLFNVVSIMLRSGL